MLFEFLIHALVLVSLEQAGLFLYQALPSKTCCVLLFTVFFSLISSLSHCRLPLFLLCTVWHVLNHDWQLLLSLTVSSALPQNGLEELELHLFQFHHRRTEKNVLVKKKCLPAGWSSCWASKRRKEQIPHYRHLWRTLVSRETKKRVLLHWAKNCSNWGEGKWWDVTWCCLDVVFVSCGHFALVPTHDWVWICKNN